LGLSKRDATLTGAKGTIMSYVTVFATPKTDKKTSQLLMLFLARSLNTFSIFIVASQLIMA
jgi:hypothetical protein